MTSDTQATDQQKPDTQVEATTSSTERAETFRSEGFLWNFFVGLLPLLGMLPMLLFEASDLWSRDYMRFVPLALLALAVLVGLNLRQAVPTVNPLRRWIAIGLLSLAATLYLVSVWQFLPWFSHLALTFAFGAWALGRFGNLHWATPVAWTFLLATTMQLPANGGETLINGLQVFSAWATTMALDALSVPCINSGMLIETRGTAIFADEVCGGWASFFAFVSFAVLLSTLYHRSAVVSVITLLSVPIWLVLSNLIRLTAICLTVEYAGRDMSLGWDYRLLEICTSGLVLGLIWLTSSLWTRLLEPLPATDAEFGPIFSGLNKMFCWPQPDPIESAEPEDEEDKKRFLRYLEKKAAKAPKWSPFHWQSDQRAVWLVRVSSLLIVLGAVIPIGRLASQGVKDLNFRIPQLTSESVGAFATEESMPPTLEGGWQRVRFDRLQRSPRSGFGEFGVVWAYVTGDKRLDASIDLPFLGWHDPVVQRELRGWTVEAERVRWQDNWVWCEAELENELGGRAFLLYSMFGPNADHFSRLSARLAAIKSDDSHDSLELQSDTQVTYQFQVLIESGERLSRADQERIRSRFLELREIARSLGHQAAQNIPEKAADVETVTSN